MASFKKNQTIQDFQKVNAEIYELQDDRMYSTEDLLAQQQRFAMRALKGIRKNNIEKVKTNLLISFSWLSAIANRLHIDIENELWDRFPSKCSYCGETPCLCKVTKVKKRTLLKKKNSLRPRTLDDFQKMFATIYPPEQRTLTDAGVHFAEEVGEVSEAIHNFLGQHLERQFEEIKLEIADVVSCMFGVANSAGISVAQGLGKMFSNNCHECHKVPCVCGFSYVTKIKT